jgi:hypothetical protein
MDKMPAGFDLKPMKANEMSALKNELKLWRFRRIKVNFDKTSWRVWIG